MAQDVLNELIDSLYARDALRVAVYYDGDDYDVVYRREDVAGAFTDEEFDELVKNVVLKGLDETRDQSEFNRWGALDATARWFHEVVLIHVPLDEWEGAFLSFDRQETDDYGALVNDILTFMDAHLGDGANTEPLEDRF